MSRSNSVLAILAALSLLLTGCGVSSNGQDALLGSQAQTGPTVDSNQHTTSASTDARWRVVVESQEDVDQSIPEWMDWSHFGIQPTNITKLADNQVQDKSLGTVWEVTPGTEQPSSRVAFRGGKLVYFEGSVDPDKKMESAEDEHARMEKAFRWQNCLPESYQLAYDFASDEPNTHVYLYFPTNEDQVLNGEEMVSLTVRSGDRSYCWFRHFSSSHYEAPSGGSEFLSLDKVQQLVRARTGEELKSLPTRILGRIRTDAVPGSFVPRAGGQYAVVYVIPKTKGLFLDAVSGRWYESSEFDPTFPLAAGSRFKDAEVAAKSWAMQSIPRLPDPVSLPQWVDWQKFGFQPTNVARFKEKGEFGRSDFVFKLTLTNQSGGGSARFAGDELRSLDVYQPAKSEQITGETPEQAFQRVREVFAHQDLLPKDYELGWSSATSNGEVKDYWFFAPNKDRVLNGLESIHLRVHPGHRTTWQYERNARWHYIPGQGDDATFLSDQEIRDLAQKITGQNLKKLPPKILVMKVSKTQAEDERNGIPPEFHVAYPLQVGDERVFLDATNGEKLPESQFWPSFPLESLLHPEIK